MAPLRVSSVPPLHPVFPHSQTFIFTVLPRLNYSRHFFLLPKVLAKIKSVDLQLVFVAVYQLVYQHSVYQHCDQC